MKKIISVFLFLVLVSLSAFLSGSPQNPQARVAKVPQEKGRILTVGEHGTFKGADGFQMALNMAQDMDEIRIEAGTYQVSGLEISKSKSFEHGIKIDGGWDSTFEKTVASKEEATILNGGEKRSSILTITPAKGYIRLEYLTFKNSWGGAIFVRIKEAYFDHCKFNNNSCGGEHGSAVNGSGTFTNCTFADNLDTAVYGAGIFTNCTFTDNFSSNGGAVVGDGTFTNCTFRKNSANRGDRYAGITGYGGAVMGDGTFTNCTFTDNFSGQEGGAIAGKEKGTFISCIFANNSAKDGGAVKGNGTFTNCTFTNNTAGAGGAVYVDRSGNFTNCTFTNCSAKKSFPAAGRGGAVYVNGGVYVHGSGAFTNCIFNNNSAEEAIVWGEGENLITNCTFYGNKEVAFSGNGKIFNSIFYKNTFGGEDKDITSMGNLDIDYSLVNAIKGGCNYGAHNIMGDPKFLNPEKGDLHLLPDSPCIDTGTLPQGFTMPSTDLDGKPRIIGKKIDMGAFEYQKSAVKSVVKTEIKKY